MPELDLGNGYSIDFADVQKFVQILQDTRDNLLHVVRAHWRELQIPAPGHDEYSGAWADNANQVRDEYLQWNQQRQAELNDLISRVNMAMAGYQRTEQHNTIRH